MIARSLLAAAVLGCSISAGAASLIVGSPAPDIELTLIDGGTVRLADLKGQLVGFNFCATWCVPRRTELPLLDAYYHWLKDKGLRVYAIKVESSLPLYRLKPLFAQMAIPSVRGSRA